MGDVRRPPARARRPQPRQQPHVVSEGYSLATDARLHDTCEGETLWNSAGPRIGSASASSILGRAHVRKGQVPRGVPMRGGLAGETVGSRTALPGARPRVSTGGAACTVFPGRSCSQPQPVAALTQPPPPERKLWSAATSAVTVDCDLPTRTRGAAYFDSLSHPVRAVQGFCLSPRRAPPAASTSPVISGTAARGGACPLEPPAAHSTALPKSRRASAYAGGCTRYPS